MFVWFVLGEKNDSGRTPAEDPPLQNDHCTTLRVVSKLLIINELVVEATGVELFRVSVYCTKIVFSLEFPETP
jgi:hypothetical protein